MLILQRKVGEGTDNGIALMRTLDGNGTENGWRVSVDSSDNIYVVASTTSYVTVNTNYEQAVIKYDNDLNLIWQKTLGTPGVQLGENCYGVDIDSSGNVYVIGDGTYYNVGIQAYITKLSSSGNVTWTKFLGSHASQAQSTETFRYVRAISPSEIDVWGSETLSQGGSAFNLFAAKYNSSGTVTNRRSFSNSHGNGNIGIYDATTTLSNSYYYIAGWCDTNEDAYRAALIVKAGIGGQISWTKTINGSLTNHDYARGIDSDGFDNVYAACQLDTGHLIKFNSSGTIQWQMAISNFYINGVTADASGNSYAIGYITGDYDGCIIKFDTNGIVVWQRSVASVGNIQLRHGHLDSSGDLIVTGFAPSSSTIFIMKCTPDGLGKGIYTAIGEDPIEYKEITLSIQASMLTANSSGMANNGSPLFTYGNSPIAAVNGPFTEKTYTKT